jgi:hypothetical protein
MWVEITDTDGSGKYSVTALEPLPNHDMTANEEWFYGDHDATTEYAIEINGCKDCVIGDKVRALPANSQDYLTFDYSGKATSAKASGTITARSGSTAGTGLASVEDLDPSTGTYSASGEVVVYNPYTAAIPTGTVIHITVNRQGCWEVDGADCED